jgi:hydrogenase-4 membrane subunit HyfE
MRIPQLKLTPKFLHLSQVLSLWIKELGRVLIFSTTSSVVLSIIMLDTRSSFYTIAFFIIGAMMMLVSAGVEYWLLRKKFDAINRY